MVCSDWSFNRWSSSHGGVVLQPGFTVCSLSPLHCLIFIIYISESMKARTWYVLLTLMWAIMFWSINVSLNRTKALTDEEVVEIPPVAVRNKWLGCHLSRDPAKNELLCRSWSSISQHFDAEAVLDGFTEVMPRSLYTFSAYYDHRDDSVRILALTAGQNANSQKQRHVCCVLQYSDGSGNHLYDIVTADFISFYEMHLNRLV